MRITHDPQLREPASPPTSGPVLRIEPAHTRTRVRQLVCQEQNILAALQRGQCRFVKPIGDDNLIVRQIDDFGCRRIDGQLPAVRDSGHAQLKKDDRRRSHFP
ncbi:MAG TPA: hypothetical protein EYP14_18710 [Planctomycetaceae bacterium]|nr:hypothetical protein [Planctomycetaceae bacterium]